MQPGEVDPLYPAAEDDDEIPRTIDWDRVRVELTGVERVVRLLREASGFTPPAPTSKVEGWQRIAITPDIELSVRAEFDTNQLMAFQRVGGSAPSSPSTHRRTVERKATNRTWTTILVNRELIQPTSLATRKHLRSINSAYLRGWSRLGRKRSRTTRSRPHHQSIAVAQTSGSSRKASSRIRGSKSASRSGERKRDAAQSRW